MTGRLHIILILCGCLVLFFWGSWQLPLLGPDEPRYAQVAREMLESGDFIGPKLAGYIWFEKPVLLYWLIALSYSLFGINEFAARVPSVVVAIATVWFLYYTIRRLAGPKEAILGAMILGSSAFFVGFSHAATFDMLLTACVSASLCSYLLHERFPQKNWVLLMYVFAGAGVLAKGFVALVIIGITLTSYIVLTKQWRSIPSIKPLTGILIASIVIAIWFLPVSLIYGWRFWDEFVYQHHFVRFTSSYYHRTQGPLFYIPVLVAGTYPWSFVPFAAKPNRDRLTLFALCWMIGPLLFFSLSKTKLPGYILPIAPAFALLAGLALAKVNATSWRMPALCVALQILLAGALFWGARKYEAPMEPLILMLIAVAAFTMISLFFFLRKSWIAACASYVLIMLSASVLFVFGIYPRLAWSDSKMLSIQWNQVYPGGYKLVPYNVYDFGPLFYTNGRMELNPRGYPNIMTNASQLHRYMMQNGEVHAYTGNDDLEWMNRADFWRVDNVFKGKERSIIILKPRSSGGISKLRDSVVYQ